MSDQVKLKFKGPTFDEGTFLEWVTEGGQSAFYTWTDAEELGKAICQRFNDHATLVNAGYNSVEEAVQSIQAKQARVEELQVENAHLVADGRWLNAKMPSDFATMTDAELSEELEYAPTCRCVICQWLRFELARRQQLAAATRKLEVAERALLICAGLDIQRERECLDEAEHQLASQK